MIDWQGRLGEDGCRRNKKGGWGGGGIALQENVVYTRPTRKFQNVLLFAQTVEPLLSGDTAIANLCGLYSYCAWICRVHVTVLAQLVDIEDNGAHFVY